MTYILLLVFTIYPAIPGNIQVTEFQTKVSCEIALKEAKKYWKVKDDESKCISVENELKKEKLQYDLNKIKSQIDE